MELLVAVSQVKQMSFDAMASVNGIPDVSTYMHTSV